MLRVLLLALVAAALVGNTTGNTASSYTSSGSQTTASSNVTASSYTSSAPAPPADTIITQRITFSFALSDYTGALKDLCEKAYGLALGIYTSSGGYVTGSNVTSTAVAARRDTHVTFQATVPHAYAAAATNSSNGLNATTMAAHVASVKSAEASLYSNVSNFTVTGVQAPVITTAGSPPPSPPGATTTTTSGSSRAEASFAGLAVAVLVTSLSRH